MTERPTPDQMPPEPYFGDSELEPLFKSLREYEKLLNDVSHSPEETQTILEILKMQWPYQEKTLTLSGQILTFDQDSPAQLLTRLQAKDVPVVWRDFCVYEDVDENGCETGRLKIGHYLEVFHQTDEEEGSLLVRDTRAFAYASPDEVAFEYPHTSFEALKARLNYHYPEVMADIDGRLKDAPDECAALKALSGLELNLPIHASNGEDDNEFAEYLGGNIEFDADFPYVITFRGLALQLLPNQAVVMNYPNFGAAIKPLGFYLIPKYEFVNEGELQLVQDVFQVGLRARVLADKKENDPVEPMVFPLTDTLSLRSVRNLIYQPPEERGTD